MIGCSGKRGRERVDYIPSSVSVTSSLAVLARKSAIGACILTSQFLKVWDLGVAGGAWNDFFFVAGLQLEAITGPREKLRGLLLQWI
jgi:hypothetical protein